MGFDNRPSVTLNPGQEEVDALQSYLKTKLDLPTAPLPNICMHINFDFYSIALAKSSSSTTQEIPPMKDEDEDGFEVGELAGVLYRPNFKSDVVSEFQ